MKYLTVLFLFTIIACNTACTINVDEELLHSREVSKQLRANLKNKLMNAMRSGGPEKAISICNLEAMNITKVVSNINNLKVGRTSLKFRNQINQPDAWEIEQLKWFESQNKLGVDINSLETHEIIKQGNKKEFRYMKAIAIQEPCLHCHGANIAPAIEEKINNLYPNDQARGYQLGQIRGAITIKKSLRSFK